VERLFRTLQDRLVKELRLTGAKTIQEANVVLEKYLVDHNARYMIAPVKQANLHRRAPAAVELDDILSISKEHVLRNDFTVAHESRLYQVLNWTSAKKVVVREYVDGRLAIIGFHNKRLKYKIVNKRPVVKRQRMPAKAGRLSKKHRIKWLVGNWAW